MGKFQEEMLAEKLWDATLLCQKLAEKCIPEADIASFRRFLIMGEYKVLLQYLERTENNNKQN